MTRFFFVSTLLIAAVGGCKADPECEKLRLELAGSWGDLRESASKRKLAGVDAEGWQRIEKNADLLESSFATSQITWSSADKARAEFPEQVKSVQTDSPANLAGYQLSAEAAIKQQDAFSQRCR